MAIEVRAAGTGDAAQMARLHAQRIDEGFLPTLGRDFLTRLYRRVAKSPHAFGSVALDERGCIVGFGATATDVGLLYRSFVLHDGLVAGLLAAPKIARSWRRVLETLRYPAHADSLPRAEILAVAVDESVSGRGVGRALVRAAQHELERRRVDTVKVVAGSHNTAALALYRGCGFAEVATIAVHEGVASTVLVWPTPESFRE